MAALCSYDAATLSLVLLEADNYTAASFGNDGINAVHLAAETEFSSCLLDRLDVLNN